MPSLVESDGALEVSAKFALGGQHDFVFTYGDAGDEPPKRRLSKEQTTQMGRAARCTGPDYS